MILLFNILWFIIIWWVYSLIYLIGWAILYITVIFLPFWKTFFEIWKLCAFPIWKRIIKNDNIWNFENKYGIILNIIWLITFWIPLFIINWIIWLLIIPIYLINMVFMLIWIITFPLFLIMLWFFPVILALTSLILKLAKISLWPIWIKIVTDEWYYKNLIKKELKNYQPKDLNNDKNLNNNLDNKVTIKYNDPNVIELVDEEELNKK